MTNHKNRTIYVPTARESIWVAGEDRAYERCVSMSVYILNLIEQDVMRSGTAAAWVETEDGQ